jgi:hypothetical protein
MLRVDAPGPTVMVLSLPSPLRVTTDAPPRPTRLTSVPVIPRFAYQTPGQSIRVPEALMV